MKSLISNEVTSVLSCYPLNGPDLGQLTAGTGVFFQLGLRKQRSTGKVKLDEVYTSGRYLIGPDYTFKTFTADTHYEELKKIVTFSKDKVEVEITCAMQYFLRPEDLKDMHQEYDLYYRLDLLFVFTFLHNLRHIFKNTVSTLLLNVNIVSPSVY